MTRYLYAAAVAAIGIGTAMVYGGVLTGGILTAGVLVIGVGLLLAAAGGIADTFAHE